jgi:hypothetical protein
VTPDTRIYSHIVQRSNGGILENCESSEDTITSINYLEAGKNVFLLNYRYFNKPPTQSVPGGCTESFYKEGGTVRKSVRVLEMKPSISDITFKFNRIHHTCSYVSVKKNNMTLVADIDGKNCRMVPSMPGEEFDKIVSNLYCNK